MNHFDAINLQQKQTTATTSSMSLLSDDKEMNQSYYHRKHVNDEYINSLLSFIHNVEETKRCHQKKMASKVNDPWDCLMTPTATPSKLPIFHDTPSTSSYHPEHQAHSDYSSPLPPKLDQNRMPLTSHKIPRRNVIKSTLYKYTKKLQEKCHRRVPSFIFVTNDEISSVTLPSGDASLRDFRPLHPDDVMTLEIDWRNNRKMKPVRTMGTHSGTSSSTHSDSTWVVTNQTSVFC